MQSLAGLGVLVILSEVGLGNRGTSGMSRDHLEVGRTFDRETAASSSCAMSSFYCHSNHLCDSFDFPVLLL